LLYLLLFIILYQPSMFNESCTYLLFQEENKKNTLLQKTFLPYRMSNKKICKTCKKIKICIKKKAIMFE
jgi:hypothetical protein